MKKSYILILFIFLFVFNIELKADLSEWGFSKHWQIVLQVDSSYFEDPIKIGYLNHIDFYNETEGLACYRYRNKNWKEVINIYYTSDNGSTWEQTGELISEDYGITHKSSGGVVDMKVTDNGNLVFLCMGLKSQPKQACIIKSTNKGETWVKKDIGKKLFSYYTRDRLLVIDENTYIILTDSEAYKTFDGGDSWEELELPVGGRNYKCLIKGQNNDVFIVFSKKGVENRRVYYSSDNGDTWEEFETPITDQNIWQTTSMAKDRWVISTAYYYQIKGIQKAGIFSFNPKTSELDTLVYNNEKVYIGADFSKTVNGVSVCTDENDWIYYSIDNGQTYQKLITGKTVRKDRYDVGITEDGIIHMFSMFNGFMVRFNPYTSVESDIETFNSKIYPNPTKPNSQVYVSLENDKARNAVCKIFSLNGNLIEQSQEVTIPKGYHTLDFKTDGYVPGTYFLVVESNGEIITREKFIIK